MDNVTIITFSLAVAAWLALGMQWMQYQHQRKELKARILTLEEIEQERTKREEDSRRRTEFEKSVNRQNSITKYIANIKYNKEQFERALTIYHLFANVALGSGDRDEIPVVKDFLNSAIIYYGRMNRYDLLINENASLDVIEEHVKEMYDAGGKALAQGKEMLSEMVEMKHIQFLNADGSVGNIEDALIGLEKVFTRVDAPEL